jgi:outer membrane protein TolC
MSPKSHTLLSKMTRLGGLHTLLVIALAGCANLSPDQGMSAIQSMTARGLGQDAVKIRSEEDAAFVRERAAVLLRKPLTAEAAVQIALLNNRNLQAAYNELGISEAQLAATALPPSPTLAYALLAAGDALEIERQIAVDVLAILTLPRRQDIAETRFRAAQLKVMKEVLRLARETERAYIRTVASTQTAAFLTKAQASAEAVSELAKKLGETGAMNKLDQAREHAFYAELSAQLGTARLRQSAEREALTRLLGLWGGDIHFRLPGELKPLPAKPKTLDAAEQEAITNRVDLCLLRIEIEAQAKALGLTEAARFIDVLEISAAGKNQKENLNVNGTRITDNEHLHGAGAGFQIPIFDLGETKLQAGREAYMQGVNRLIAKAVSIRSEARAAYTAYRGSYDIARHYRDQVAPLRKIIADEDLLRYNGMLLDPFQLLADTRANVTSSIAGIEALRDFWLAKVDLQAALLGGGQGAEPQSLSAATSSGATE